jgi:peptidoglycan/LPS O-acetylase OafA/YrhL
MTALLRAMSGKLGHEAGTTTVRRPESFPADASDDTAQRRFRPDIEGLRAVAVIAVVLSHASLGLPGGYVGVDVFFVISGFLITRQLFEEGNRRGKFSFAKFYARRARRILPAATVVTLATLAAAYFWAPPLRVAGIARDGLAAALFSVNWRLAAQGTNYFQASSPPSPFQHYWSLSVEEQFYLVWPLLLAVLFLLFRNRAHRTKALVVVLVLLIAASLWTSAYITHRSQPYAYFGTHTRVWELALGALLAVTADGLRRIPRVLAGVVGWLGLAGIVAACFVFDNNTAYPGTAAVLPVAGAGLIIAAGCGSAARFGPESLLKIWPMRWTGKISYSLYLWHWPLLILLPDALGHPLAVRERVIAIAAAVVLSVATYFLIEQPFQHQQALVAKPQRAFALATGLISASIAVAVILPGLITIPGGSGTTSPALTAASASQAADPGNPSPTAGPSGSAGAPTGPASNGTAPTGSAATGTAPTAAAVTYATVAVATPPVSALLTDAQLAARLNLAVAQTQLPSNLLPSLTKVGSDLPNTTNTQGCQVQETPTVPKLPCDQFGDPNGTKQVVLIGDSHAGQWLASLNAVAITNHWRLTLYSKSDCPIGNYPDFINTVLKRTYPECTAWRTDVFARINAMHPALVVIGSRTRTVAATEESGMESSVKALTASGAKVVYMGDTPSPAKIGSVPDCLSQHTSDIQKCNVPRSTAGLTAAGRVNEMQAAQSAGATVIDPTPWFCTASVCPVVVQGVQVFADESHMSETYGLLLAPQLGAKLLSALAT